MREHDERLKKKEYEINVEIEKTEEIKQSDTLLHEDLMDQSEVKGKKQDKISDGFVVVEMQDFMAEREAEVPKEEPLEIIKNKQTVVQDGADAEVPPTEEIKEKMEKEKPAPLPKSITDVMERIVAWTGKLSEESSQPVVTAIRGIKQATSTEEMGQRLAELSKAALDYLKLRSGFRWTSDGRTRQRDVKALVGSIEEYLPTAQESYALKIKEKLVGNASSVDEMPKAYRDFYKKNSMYLQDTDAMAKEFSKIYADKENEQQDEERLKEPRSEVKLSKKSAAEYVGQFADKFEDKMTKEEREAELSNENSVIGKKQQNRKELKALTESNEESEEEKKEITKRDFIALLDDYIKTDTDNIDFSSDESIIKCAPRMESLVKKHTRLIEGIIKHRTFYRSLPRDTQSFLGRKIKSTSLICGYYRVSKMIISDDLYSTHRDDELSMGAKYSDGYKKYRLSLLLATRMQLEHKLAALCSKDGKQAQLDEKECEFVFQTENAAVEGLQEQRNKLFSSINAYEFDKNTITGSTKNQILFKQLQSYNDNSPEYKALAENKYELYGEKTPESLIRRIENFATLRGVNGLGMAHQEFLDLLSDLMAKPSETMTEEKAKECRVRAFKKIRDLFMEHARYITDKYKGSFIFMNPDVAFKHREEILQDMKLTTNLGETFAFFLRCPSLCDSKEQYDEIWKLSEKIAGISHINLSHGSSMELKVGMEDHLKNEAGYINHAASIFAAPFAGTYDEELMSAHSALSMLESNTHEDKIQWEGTTSEEEFKKAEELEALGETAYTIKKQTEREFLTKEESKNVKIAEAKTQIDDAIKTIPVVTEFTMESVTANLAEWKNARIQWEAIKSSEELTNEEKQKYESFSRQFDAMEGFLDAFTKTVRHPDYIRLTLRGFELPTSGLMEPGYTTSQISSYKRIGEGVLTQSEQDALSLLMDVVRSWGAYIASSDEAIATQKQKILKIDEDESQNEEQRGKEAEISVVGYSSAIGDVMEDYEKEKGFVYHNNKRKAKAYLMGLSLLGNASLEECKQVYQDISQQTGDIIDDEVAVTKAAKAVEKLFDVLLNIDFNKIHLEEENVFKDVAYSRTAFGFGMETQSIFDDYLEYMESGKVKDMAYDKEKLALVRGRYNALQVLNVQVGSKRGILLNPAYKTEMGQKLMRMSHEQISDWFAKEKKKYEKDVHLMELSTDLLYYKANMMVYRNEHNNETPTVEKVLADEISKAKEFMNKKFPA